jgi:hypothetical protein
MGEIYEVETSNPLCGEEEFAELVAEMVRDEAPRLFAVVQEIGEREDGRIAAWGMAFDDHAAVMRDRSSWLSVSSPDRACRMLSRAPDVTARLVWVAPVRTEQAPGPDGPSGTGPA